MNTGRSDYDKGYVAGLKAARRIVAESAGKSEKRGYKADDWYKFVAMLVAISRNGGAVKARKKGENGWTIDFTKLDDRSDLEGIESPGDRSKFISAEVEDGLLTASFKDGGKEARLVARITKPKEKLNESGNGACYTDWRSFFDEVVALCDKTSLAWVDENDGNPEVWFTCVLDGTDCHGFTESDGRYFIEGCIKGKTVTATFDNPALGGKYRLIARI